MSLTSLLTIMSNNKFQWCFQSEFHNLAAERSLALIGKSVSERDSRSGSEIMINAVTMEHPTSAREHWLICISDI